MFKNKSFLSISVALLLFLSCSPGFSASFIYNYDHRDGLFQATIRDIANDNRNFMLFASQDGLLVSNGLTFKNYRNAPSSPIALPSNRIRSILKTQSGNNLLGTSRGLSLFNGQQQSITQIQPDFKESVVDLIDKNGDIWVITLKGQVYLLTADFQTISKVFQLKEKNLRISAVTKDLQNNLWIGTRKHGLFHYDTSKGQLQKIVTQGTSISALFADLQGKIWIGSADNKGIELYEASSLNPMHSANPTLRHHLKEQEIKAIFLDSQGALWFGSYNGGGLFRYEIEKDTLRQFKATHSQTGIVENQVVSIFEDSSRNLWVGTVSGLSKISLNKLSFGHYYAQPENNDLNNKIITGVFEDKNNTLWVGTFGGGLHRYNDELASLISVPMPENDVQKNALNFVIAINESGNSQLFVGTTNGLYLLDTIQNLWLSFENQFHFENKKIFDIRSDDLGNLWITTDKGLLIFNTKYQQVCNAPNIIQNARHIYSMGQSMMVVSKNNSYQTYLARVEPQNCEAVLVEKLNLPGLEKHEPLLVDTEDFLWTSTRTGVTRIKVTTGEVFSYSEADGLPNNIVYGALQDATGHIWLSTNNGLSKFDKQTQQFQNFTYIDGLQSNEFNGEASVKRANGDFFFGGINGFNLFTPDNVLIGSAPPELYLTIKPNNPSSLQAHESSSVPLSSVTNQVYSLQPDNHNIELEFVASHFQDPHLNKYRYRLLGLENEWTYADATNRTARYTNLAAGNYTFAVSSKTSQSDWSAPVTLSLQVPTPAHLSVLAFVFYAVLGVCFVALLVRWRTITLQRDKSRLETEVSERTQHIELQKQQIETQMRDLITLGETQKRFFESISHEFRTPLTLTIGPLKQIYDELDGQQLKHKLDIPIRQASKLLRLINQLLELSRIQSGAEILTLRKYKLSDQIRRITRDLNYSVQSRNLSLKLALDDDIVFTYDAAAMEKIIVNLMSNAINYNRTNGNIEVRTRWDQQQVIIEVEDNGRGMSEEQQKHLFDRFQSIRISNNNYQGLGIGLNLVKELVDLHHGTIECDSREDIGTRFSIVLPLGSPNDLPVTKLDESDSTSTNIENDIISTSRPIPELSDKLEEINERQNTHLLIVDDEKDMRIYLRSVFKDFRVTLASNGLEALETAQSEIPDLIISDIMMPTMDGIQMVQQLKEHRNTSHIPVILLSAKGSKESRIKGLREGIDDYIVKPFDEDELRLKASNLMAIRAEIAKNLQQTFTHSGKTVISSPVESKFLMELNNFLEAHYEDPNLTLINIADGMYLEKRQLQRKLKAIVDTSPIEYLRTFRLQKAASQLLEGLSVSEVFVATGFSGIAHFSRCFKAYYGVNPSQYFEYIHKEETSEIK